MSKKRKEKKAAAEAAAAGMEMQEPVSVTIAAAEPEKKGKQARKEKKAEKQAKKAVAKSRKEKKAAQKLESSAKKSGVLTNPIRNMIITAVVCLLLGLGFIVETTLVYTYCGYIIGGLVALIGVVYLIIYFVRKPVSGIYRSEFATGMLALLAGAYVALSGLISGSDTGVSMTLAVIVRILGVLVAADGILKLQYTLDLARMKYRKWWICLITGVLGIAVGVLTTLGIVYQLGTDTGIGGMVMLGIGFCLNAVLDLIAMIVVAVRNHKANKAEALAEAEALKAAALAGEESEAFFTAESSSAAEEAAPSAAAPMTIELEPAPEPAPAAEQTAVLETQPEPVPAETEAAEPVLPAPAPAASVSEGE